MKILVNKILIIVSIMSCSCNLTTDREQKTEKTIEDIENLQGAAKIEKQNSSITDNGFLGSFKLNQEGQVIDYFVTITKVIDNDKMKDEYIKPDQGNKYITIEVIFRNPKNSNIQITPNPWFFKLMDEMGETYDIASAAQQPNNIINSGAINPDRQAKGTVTFEVPSEFKPYVIKFNPFNEQGVFLKENIEFLLN
ncbi:MAG: DUF4352 domain-containing protein [Bacteroidia bacterium]|nr:DUF4352 domain-containing protein [Bacteroidia bacterium]MBP7260954.1 DUF4352 domain-containing protein [Bacteroidia bacterium]MBP9180433.1 DUF4352 domain-containing protein [Bacteroidia bacterium]MBP9723580.1 DUF4352 domain-containing protein [Bacteroidia bacterium]